ncbi:MAG: GNAT family N-acetyltransferase [Hyphomicrobiales bacterium]|nr:GNAT family N-acetyltransferase [Hyphomicrobiales bacterium]
MLVSSPIAEGASPGPVIVRALTTADAAETAEVVCAAFAAQSRATRPPSSALGETAGSIAGKLEAGGGFGAFADGAPVAVALFRIEGETMQIARVATLPSWRGKGLARELIARCEAAARAAGLRRMSLRVRLELPENERFFASLGFGRRRVEAHQGYDRPTTAVMEREL